MRQFFVLLVSLMSFDILATEEEITNKLAEVVKSKKAIKSSKSINLDGFKLESVKANVLGKDFEPSSTTTHLFNVSNPNSVSINIGIDSNPKNSYGAAIFQKNSGQPYVSVNDTDGDGVLDFLTYSVLNVEGELILSVEDFGMDGQADFKLNFVTDEAWVFWESEWRKVIGANSERYIVVDDQRIILKSALERLGRNVF
ncbi:hypothetical protein [Psychrosphaera haliotis]|uniref:VCBS repeat-containing protein n=1 Tax=Psychrosphaera haliotis TaxID=555083 RepID=A0A6N8F751_9GAMM|nr:hypothetical protein [Psychrosphaera haliotis]MUH72058.1 hypothetical protein [Psychrosphaera haliotis]